MRVQTQEVADNVVKYVSRRQLRLLWNPSIYSLIVVSEGNSYREIVGQVRELRRNLDLNDIRTDTATLLTIESGKDDVRSEKGIGALVFAKLKRKNAIGKVNAPWSCLDHSFRFPPMILGDYDQCLMVKQKSIADIMKSIFDLRHEFEDRLERTCTILLFERGGGNV